MPYCLFFYFCSVFPPGTWPYMVECFLSFDNPPPLTKTSTNSESHARPSSKTDQVCKSPSRRNIQRMQQELETETRLLDSHRLGQVTGEVNIETLHDRQPVGNQLQGNDVQETLQDVNRLGDLDRLCLAAAELVIPIVANDNRLATT